MTNLREYNDREQARRYSEFEMRMQPKLDQYYKYRGFNIERRPTKEYDCKLNSVTVEEKIRTSVYQDILIEILQDLVKHTLGWFYTTNADYLYYAMCMNGDISELHMIQWPQFKHWCLSKYWPDKGMHGKYLISPKGIGLTLNLKIPIKHIPEELMGTCYPTQQLILV